MTTRPPGISPPLYNTLLKDIAQIYEQMQSDGNENWNKATLYSNWKIGQRIVEVEQGNEARASYGDRVLKQLSQDLNRKFGKGFSDRNLRYMRKFFQLYKLNAVHPELSWTHYRNLLLVEDSRDRLALEKKAIRENWSHRDLLVHVNKALAGKRVDPDNVLNEKDQNEAVKSSLKRPLMGLFTYRVLQNFSFDLERSVPNLDLGFSVKLGNILHDTQKFKVGAIVKAVKKSGVYSFESGSSLKELFTYKAFLEKVVDGDTLVVNLDLGFHVFLKQRLRLRGVDAPELGTKKGVSSKKFVESSLKDCNFLIVKTHGSDKYDRYLVDVFYAKNETDQNKVLNTGIFLNNELLSEGLVDFAEGF